MNLGNLFLFLLSAPSLQTRSFQHCQQIPTCPPPPPCILSGPHTDHRSKKLGSTWSFISFLSFANTVADQLSSPFNKHISLPSLSFPFPSIHHIFPYLGTFHPTTTTTTTLILTTLSFAKKQPIPLVRAPIQTPSTLSCPLSPPICPSSANPPSQRRSPSSSQTYFWVLV